MRLQECCFPSEKKIKPMIAIFGSICAFQLLLHTAHCDDIFYKFLKPALHSFSFAWNVRQNFVPLEKGATNSYTPSIWNLRHQLCFFPTEKKSQS